MLGHNCISDINEALPRALPMLLRHGKRHTADSVANARETIEWDGLFVTEWWKPQRNVLFDPVRDANPFFHYLEAMWILAGRCDVQYLAHVLPRMADFSDDGKVFHAPYGYRLRRWVGTAAERIDQVEEAIQILRRSPNSRQVVLSVWNPALDLGTKTKDMPCNDMLMLRLRDGYLNLTVNNRSNDAVLGCYGANAVQFSMLLMYLAARIGCKVGKYWQVSNSFHVYTDNPYWQWFVDRYERDPSNWNQPLYDARCKYAELVGPEELNPFAYGIERFDTELATFMDEADAAIGRGSDVIPMFAQSLAIRTAISLWNALHWHRAKKPEAARTAVWDIELLDWQCAAREWLERRSK